VLRKDRQFANDASNLSDAEYVTEMKQIRNNLVVALQCAIQLVTL